MPEEDKGPGEIDGKEKREASEIAANEDGNYYVVY